MCLPGSSVFVTISDNSRNFAGYSGRCADAKATGNQRSLVPRRKNRGKMELNDL